MLNWVFKSRVEILWCMWIRWSEGLPQVCVLSLSSNNSALDIGECEVSYSAVLKTWNLKTNLFYYKIAARSLLHVLYYWHDAEIHTKHMSGSSTNS